jgi:hypothetical protein
MDCSCIKRTSVVAGDWRLPPCGTVALMLRTEPEEVSALRVSINYRGAAWVGASVGSVMVAPVR